MQEGCNNSVYVRLAKKQLFLHADCVCHRTADVRPGLAGDTAHHRGEAVSVADHPRVHKRDVCNSSSGNQICSMSSVSSVYYKK